MPEWNFNVVTSSPHFPQSNGLAERNVQTIKNLFKKAKEAGSDDHLALLEFRNTPISGLSDSPAQLLMGRRLRCSLPMISSTLEPSNGGQVKEKLVKQQTRQKSHYDKHSKFLAPLKPNDTVRYKHGSIWKPAMVLSEHTAPRSYIIQTSDGTILRRNRRHLKRTNEKVVVRSSYYDDDDGDVITGQHEPTIDHGLSSEPNSTPVPEVTEKRSRYGRLIKPPARYGDE